MKIKFFKKEKSFKKDLLPNPSIYWKFAVIGVFLTVVTFSIFGYYLFLKTSKESEIPIEEVGQKIGKVDKEKIQKILEYFSLREQKSEEILNSPAPIIDPSR